MKNNLAQIRDLMGKGHYPDLAQKLKNDNIDLDAIVAEESKQMLEIDRRLKAGLIVNPLPHSQELPYGCSRLEHDEHRGTWQIGLGKFSGLYVMGSIAIYEDLAWYHVSFSRRGEMPSYRDVKLVKDYWFGDDLITGYSVEQIEGLGRSFRIKMLLTQSPIVLTLALTVLDAAALYCELQKATMQLAHGDPASETALVVAEWSAEILRAIAADQRVGNFRDRHEFARLLALPTLTKLTTEEQYLVTTQIEAAIDGLDPDIEVSVSVKPYTAYLAISCLQLRTRDPICGMLNEIRHYIRKLSEGIEQICPEASWMLERGWHPEFDGGMGCQ